jgi:TRAP-type mannitol/chloroaromatic compound transport system permease large subunit
LHRCDYGDFLLTALSFVRERSFAKKTEGGLLHIQAFLMIGVVLEECLTGEQVFLELIDVLSLGFISGDGNYGINEEE